MLKKRKLIKFIAAFLLLDMLNYIFAPTMAWALTAGPTAPEATSFEPVDTTDMVNLLTGDLVYNIPLLEVPGPSGGYPLSLSYHGGILTNEEASWVGLGWTLNPGAINRSVNGYADDHQNEEVEDRFYWEGGERFIAEVGLTIGVSGAASVGAGLSVGYDTYQGTGVGFYFEGSGGPLSVRGGIDPWGNINMNTRLGLGLVSVSTDGRNISSDFRLPINDNIGLSISSSGRVSGDFTMNEGQGQFGIHNSKKGRVSTQSFSFASAFNVFPRETFAGKVFDAFIPLSFLYQRYWIDENEEVNTNGSLYFPNQSISVNWLNDHAYDSYSLNTSESLIEGYQPDQVRGGTFASYDHYSVNAQGVSGSFRPHLLKKYLHKETYRNYNDITEEYDNDIIHYELGFDQNPVQFRFENEFSNRYEFSTDLNQMPVNSTNLNSALSYDFSSGTKTSGEFGNDGIVNNHLIGSQNIEYITNGQINDPMDTKAVNIGFIETSSTGFDRTLAPISQIGGYVITNSSGAKYNFSLPVYAREEFQFSENINQSNGQTFNQTWRPAKYAYMWLLTSLTGPDYIDRGAAGFDESDWGYWVEFEYGKWTDQFAWRNPTINFKEDLDHNFKNFSEGVKELYYLDAIRTKTHTALFAKDIRDDAKSSLLIMKSEINGKVGLADEGREGGFIPKSATRTVISGPDVDQFTYLAKPVSSLKLKKILLLKNDDLSLLGLDKSIGNLHDQSITYDQTIVQQHFPDNVLGIEDIDNDYHTNALRVIDFSTDQSLVPETANSYSSLLLAPSSPSTDPANYPLKGKLTLNSLHFKGKGGIGLIPPIKFNYDYKKPLQGLANMSQGATPEIFSFVEESSGLKKGDLLRIESSELCYAYVTGISGNTHTIKIIGKDYPTDNAESKWQITKNPPHNTEFYDHWGHYKADYQSQYNENIDRITSNTSAKQTDVWSLMSIETSIGNTIDVEYEADSYSKAIFYRNNSYIIQNLTNENVGAGTIDINIFSGNGDLTEIFDVGDQLDIWFMYYENNSPSPGQTTYNRTVYPVNVSSVSANNLTIVGQNFVNFLYNYAFPIPEPDDPDAMNRHFIGGNLFPLNDSEFYGGGVRVASITSLDPYLDKEHITEYDYSDPNNPTVISGVTSYEPVGINKFDNYGYSDDDPHIKDYRGFLYNSFSDLMINAREAPAPGVMYEHVNVKQSIVQSDGSQSLLPFYTAYQFEVLDDRMIEVETDHPATNPGLGPVTFENISIDNNLIARSKIVIKDFTSRIGSLKKVIHFDQTGNKITESINHYLHDEISTEHDANTSEYEPLIFQRFANQGVIEETFINARFARDTRDIASDKHQLIGVISKKEFYPSIQTGQTTVDYKKGITTTSSTLGYDFYSGAATEIISEDAHGNHLYTKTQPAYRVYGDINGDMGSPVYGGKNMLVQEAGSFTYKVNSESDLTPVGLVAANIQTWNDRWSYRELGGSLYNSTDPNTDPYPVWRKHRNYSWRGDDVALRSDGLYPVNAELTFDAWNSGQTPSNSQWEKQNEITLYDHYSHALEAVDINGNNAATKMGDKETKVFATATNSGYNEFAYSGAEDEVVSGFFGGEVELGQGVVSSVEVHTGTNSLELAAGQNGFTFKVDVQPNRNYRVSTWMNSTSGAIRYKIDGGADQLINTGHRQSGNWYLLEGLISTGAAINTLEVGVTSGSGTVRFDDFRFHPADGLMTSYVYDQFSGELTYILDNHNLYTRYEYDAMGRLIKTHKESFIYGSEKKLAEIDYQYGREFLDNLADLSGTLIKSGSGAAETLTASIDPGTEPYSYKWFNKGSEVPGETSNVYGPNSCDYDVKLEVRDKYNRRLDLYADKHENFPLNVDPIVVTDLGGGTKRYTVNVTSGSPPYTYNWSITGEQFSGGTDNYRDVQGICAYSGSVTVSDICGNSQVLNFSNPAPPAMSMILTDDPPSGGLRQITATTNREFASTTFNWKVDGSPLPPYTTTSGVSVKSVDECAALVEVTATTECGDTNNKFKNFSTVSGGIFIASNNPLTFQVNTSNARGTPTYSWNIGNPIPGGTQTVVNETVYCDFTVTCNITDACSSYQASYSYDAPTPTPISVSISGPSGGAITIQTNRSLGVHNNIYEWTIDGVNESNDSPYGSWTKAVGACVDDIWVKATGCDGTFDTDTKNNLYNPNFTLQDYQTENESFVFKEVVNITGAAGTPIIRWKKNGTQVATGTQYAVPRDDCEDYTLVVEMDDDCAGKTTSITIPQAETYFVQTGNTVGATGDNTPTGTYSVNHLNQCPDYTYTYSWQWKFGLGGSGSWTSISCSGTSCNVGGKINFTQCGTHTVKVTAKVGPIEVASYPWAYTVDNLNGSDCNQM